MYYSKLYRVDSYLVLNSIFCISCSQWAISWINCISSCPFWCELQLKACMRKLLSFSIACNHGWSQGQNPLVENYTRLIIFYVYIVDIESFDYFICVLFIFRIPWRKSCLHHCLHLPLSSEILLLVTASSISPHDSSYHS